MKGIRDAAQDRDLAALEQRVDFDRVRESLRGELREMSQEDADGLLARAREILPHDIRDSASELAVTPAGLAALVAGGSALTERLPEVLQPQAVSWDVERDGFDNFRGVGTREDGTNTPALLFERDGIGWIMVGIDLPE